MCQKDFPLKTSIIRGKLSYLEIHITPLFELEFQTIMLECSDILKRMNWMILEIGGETRKLKMHRKMCMTAHFSVHRSFYSTFV